MRWQGRKSYLGIPGFLSVFYVAQLGVNMVFKEHCTTKTAQYAAVEAKISTLRILAEIWSIIPKRSVNPAMSTIFKALCSGIRKSTEHGVTSNATTRRMRRNLVSIPMRWPLRRRTLSLVLL